MADGVNGNGDRFDADLARALRRAADEARPREEFRSALRERFVQGTAGPAPPEVQSPAPARVLRIPRWIAYPAAAAALLVAVALSGALSPRAEPEPPIRMPARLPPVETALVAAERRVESVEGLRGRTWQRRVVEGQPWLLPAEAAFADGAELETLGLHVARAGRALAVEMPRVAARTVPPTVALVAPDRRTFESLVAPRIAPLPLEEYTIAYALPDPGVLLLSPGTIAPGSPPREEMDVVHEAVHAWLHARRRGPVPLPLWADEGVAGIVSQAGTFDTRDWCRKVLAGARSAKVDPFGPAETLAFRDYGAMVRHAAERAPCAERPYSMVAVFHAHADSLVLFLNEARPDGEPGPGKSLVKDFQSWLLAALDGKRQTPGEAAAAFGYADPAALFAARDEWLNR